MIKKACNSILATQSSGELGTCCFLVLQHPHLVTAEDLLAGVLKLLVQLLKSILYDAVLFSLLLLNSCISPAVGKGKGWG